MQWFDNVQTKKRLVAPLSDLKLRLTATPNQRPNQHRTCNSGILGKFFCLSRQRKCKSFVMVTLEMGQKSKTRSIVNNTHNVAGGSETGHLRSASSNGRQG